MPRARKSTAEATPGTTKSSAASTASRPRKGTRSAPPAQAPLVPVLTSDEIARRAYELYERSGFQQGQDLDHWLVAERELQGS